MPLFALALTLATPSALAGMSFSTDGTGGDDSTSGSVDHGGIEYTLDDSDDADTWDIGGISVDLTADGDVDFTDITIELGNGIQFSLPADGVLDRDDMRALQISVAEAVYLANAPAGVSDLDPQPAVGSGRNVRTWGTGGNVAQANYDARNQAVDHCRMTVAYDSYPVRIATVYAVDLSSGEKMRTVDWGCTQGSVIASRSANPVTGVGSNASAARRDAYIRASHICGGDQHPVWRGVYERHGRNADGDQEVMY
jgi:hypothetical protein